MGGDHPVDGYHEPGGFELVIPMKDPIAAERVFNELGDGGNIKMPLQETFWAGRFGMVVDRLGIPWTINCEPITVPTPRAQ